MTMLEELKHRDYRRVFAAAIIEALDILKAAGIEPRPDRPDPARACCRTSSARPISSSARWS